ncbi:nitrate reductase [Arenicella chitinivorans]|uniref:Nitrate reductase n=1 Tax=Arenicella chitinivorans TaxID=1329800 RepID=A0A918S1J6_9GAMM|nr:nitrate reductase [Arenicella chitinivorans]GHA19314.1 nitrate reductase [Arenicella chitinivorans]
MQATTCPYCGVGCGVAVQSESDAVQVQADAQHPANLGRLCSKGSALAATVSEAGEAARILHPSIDGKQVDWTQATDHIAASIRSAIDEHGVDSVAFYLSGQLLTEDYYVANKLMKGFIGTANVDTNSRLCMSSAVAAYQRAFGADAVPCCYEDLECTDLLVLIGSNAAWTHPVLYQRMVQAKQSNPNLRVVLIDPRRTISNDLADLHLPLKPSSDGILFKGLLRHLIAHDVVDRAFIAGHTDGFAEAERSVASWDIDRVAEHTDLSRDQLTQFYDWFATTPKAISFYSQGINQSATGTDKCNDIINCHLATGRIGQPGAGPFSITGQPNAMGGREVGGLASQLAAHMGFTEPETDRVQRFWNAPTVAKQPGLKAVDLFDAMHRGDIKVVWILATNPAVSLPDSEHVRAALAKCPTVIVSDLTANDTTEYANVLLPALGWGEKDGTVTNSERRISRQRAFRPAPGEAKSDWWSLTQVAQKLGYENQFPYTSAHEVFVEHARLSGFENNGKRAFDISALSTLTGKGYDSLKPVQWPVTHARPKGTARLFTNHQFFTATQRAQFIAAPPHIIAAPDGMFLLNTGRLRDQWHTMTRTGQVASLCGHDELPFVEMHPDDAADQGLSQHQFVQVQNHHGRFIGRLNVVDSVQRGQLFAPIHWTQQFAQSAIINSVVAPVVDAVSGQPQSKAAVVSLQRFDCQQWARVVTTEPLQSNDWAYWAQTRIARGYVTLVGVSDEVDWKIWLRSRFESPIFVKHYQNPLSGQQALIASDEKRPVALVFTHANVAELPSQVWLERVYAINDSATLNQELHGELGGYDELICSCFKTTRKAITAAMEQGSEDLEALASTLGCGSKCGSCRPELNGLLRLYAENPMVA